MNELLNERLKKCSRELDACANLIQIYQVEPALENIESLDRAIAAIAEMLSRIESSEAEGHAKNQKLRENKCNFCGAEEGRVERLIAGPSVYICNDCVGLCVGIIREYNSVPNKT